MQTRINITLPQDLARQLRTQIPARQRSRFIAESLGEKLKKEEDVKSRLIKSLKANYKEYEKIAKEWEHIDLENWPEWKE